MTGCAHSRLGSRENVDYRKRAANLARELKRKNAVIDELREKNQVLATRVESSTGRAQGRVVARSVNTPPPKSEVASVVHLPKTLPPKAAKTVDAVAISVPTEKSEHLLYAKVMETYRRKDLNEMQTAVRLFLKTFPESTYADNALYLSGMLATQNSDFSGAHSYFDQIIREYPGGNKAVTALFAKGALYRNQKQWQKARALYQQVEKQFPGSAESLRVPVELKLLNEFEKAGA